MLTFEKTNELLKEIGDGSVVLDQNNYCEIGLQEGELVIALRFVPEDGRILTAAVIGDLPDSSPLALTHILGEVMKANFMWDTTSGNTLALADDSRLVVQNCYTDGSEKPFSEYLLSFAESCEYLAAWYADLKNDTMETFREEQELYDNDIDIPDDDEDSNEDSEQKHDDFQTDFSGLRNLMLQA